MKNTEKEIKDSGDLQHLTHMCQNLSVDILKLPTSRQIIYAIALRDNLNSLISSLIDIQADNIKRYEETILKVTNHA